MVKADWASVNHVTFCTNRFVFTIFAVLATLTIFAALATFTIFATLAIAAANFACFAG
jgi:hypothetical protein